MNIVEYEVNAEMFDSDFCFNEEAEEILKRPMGDGWIPNILCLLDFTWIRWN